MISTTEQERNEISLKIGVLSYPCNAYDVLFTLINILEPISTSLHVITGGIPKNKIKPDIICNITNFNCKKGFPHELPFLVGLPIWLYRQILMQAKMAYYLLKVRKDIDITLFFLWADSAPVPTLLAKILNKKIVRIITESGANCARAEYGGFLGSFIYPIYKILERINFALSDKLVTLAGSEIQGLNLEKYKFKVMAGGGLYIDTQFHSIKTPYHLREDLVGYVGRIVTSKGVEEFVKAMPLISNENKNIKFIIGGDGLKLKEIKEELKEQKLLNNVTTPGWIPREEIPDVLNKLKLLVLPSYTEGVPMIVLQSMACGTPVLVSQVGGVADAIQDEETGFILNSISPETIAENVMRAIAFADIRELIEKARTYVEENYSYDVAVRRYQRILERCAHELER